MNDMNDEFEIKIETENNIDIGQANVNPKNPALDNRAVSVKDRRSSNIFLGKNKKKLILNNGEYALSEEIIAKTMEYVANLEKKDNVTVVVKKTNRRFQRQDIEDLIKEVALEKGKLSIGEERMVSSTKAKPMTITGAERGPALKTGVLFLGKDMELPSGDYVNKAEVMAALKSYIGTEERKPTPTPPVIQTPTPVPPKSEGERYGNEPDKKQKESIIVTRIQKQFKARILPFILMGATALAVLSSNPVVKAKQAIITEEPVAYIQGYSQTTNTYTVSYEGGTYEIDGDIVEGYAQNINLNESTAALNNQNDISQLGNGEGKHIRLSDGKYKEGDYLITGFAVYDNNGNLLGALEDLDGDKQIDKTNTKVSDINNNLKDYVNKILSEHPGLSMDDIDIKLHFGSSKEAPRLGWIDMSSLIKNGNLKSDNVHGINKYSGSTKDPKNATITKEDGTVVSFSLVDSNGKYYETGSTVKGSDGLDYVILETDKKVTNVEEQKTTTKEVKSVVDVEKPNNFVIVPATIALVAAGALGLASELAAHKLNKKEGKDVTFATHQNEEVYEEYLKKFKEAKEEYKKNSPFQKVLNLLTKGKKTLKRLTPEDTLKMQKVEAVKKIFSQRYNTDITMELQKDGYLVTMSDGKSIKLNDSDIDKLYKAGLNSEVVASKSL